MRYLWMLLCLLVAVPSHAATLLWDNQTITSPLVVERSATETGLYETIATLPTGATSYILTPGAYGWYRVRNSAGPSNVVRFSADLYTGLVTDRLDALDIRATTLEVQVQTLATRLQILELGSVTAPPPPAPTSNISARQVDSDHVEVVGPNCVSLRTTGTGLRRVVECVH